MLVPHSNGMPQCRWTNEIAVGIREAKHPYVLMACSAQWYAFLNAILCRQQHAKYGMQNIIWWLVVRLESQLQSCSVQETSAQDEALKAAKADGQQLQKLLEVLSTTKQ